MKHCLILFALFCAGLYGPRVLAFEPRPAEITVGYFQQWPTPSQFAQEKKTFDSALGLEVNWIPFASGNDMTAAVESGQVQIAYALGHVPFLVAVSGGVELTMVGIAVGYADNDNCIVGDASGIDRGNARELEGKRVALQVGSVTHYRMLQVLRHLQVDVERVEIVASASGADAAQALRNGEVAMACASGSALGAMSDIGSPLLSGAEQEEIGISLFDTVAVATDFVNRHPDVVQDFMDVVEASSQQWRINPDPMRAAIARAARMARDGSDRTLATFRFPSASEQKTDAWMSAMVPNYTREIADFFVAQGRLEKALESYDSFITTRFLR